MADNRISIIVLNWNGWSDTVECLASLYNQSDYGFDIVLIDNNSQDNSIEKICGWAHSPIWPTKTAYLDLRQRELPSQLPYTTLDRTCDEFVLKEGDLPQLILIKNKENIGFARANNQGIKFVREHLQSKFYLLLNNDTFVHPNAIHHLRDIPNRMRQYSAFQAAIYHYDEPKRIWHAGGYILPWIQTRYFHKVSKEVVRKTQSLSGCALLLPKSTIDEVGLLCDKFFHGEEDLNYSMRLLQAGLKSVVVQQAIVYHKISRSSDKSWTNRSHRFINASLNRLVNTKMFFSYPKWLIWLIGTTAYYWLMLVIKYRQDPYRSIKLLRSILYYSSKIEKVDKAIIQQIMEEQV